MSEEKIPYNKYSKDKEKQILESYKDLQNAKEVGKLFGINNTSVRRVLLRNGIVPKTYSEVNRLVDPTFFNDWENVDIQYWLGVIASDGCITRGSLVVETIDKEWMENYRDFLNPNINITTYQPKKGKLLYRVAFKSKGIGQELMKYGIISQKSLQLDWTLPLTKDFVRGVFDGDGCVSVGKSLNDIRIGICGGYLPFIEKINQFLIENNIESTLEFKKNSNKNTLYYVSINKYEEKIKFFHLLYTDANYYLKRKKEKFEILFKKVHNTKRLPKKVKVIINNEVFIFKSAIKASEFIGVDFRKFSLKMSQGINNFNGYKCEYI